MVKKEDGKRQEEREEEKNKLNRNKIWTADHAHLSIVEFISRDNVYVETVSRA